MRKRLNWVLAGYWTSEEIEKIMLNNNQTDVISISDKDIKNLICNC